MLTKIVLKVEERETKTEPKKKFPVYATSTKDGKIVKVKFTRDVKNAPQEPGTYDLILDSTKSNLTKDFYGLLMWIADPNIRYRLAERTDRVKEEFETIDESDLPF